MQERIAKTHGSQCGYCTPGMVMSIYCLLRNKPRPTMEDITQALAGRSSRLCKSVVGVSPFSEVSVGLVGRISGAGESSIQADFRGYHVPICWLNNKS